MAAMFERTSLVEKMALKVPSTPGISVIYVFFTDLKKMQVLSGQIVHVVRALSRYAKVVSSILG